MRALSVSSRLIDVSLKTNYLRLVISHKRVDLDTHKGKTNVYSLPVKVKVETDIYFPMVGNLIVIMVLSKGFFLRLTLAVQTFRHGENN